MLSLISQEEYEYARIFHFTYRTEDDLRAPFLNLESDLCQSLKLLDITTCNTLDPFYHRWISAGGEESEKCYLFRCNAPLTKYSNAR